MSLLLWRTLDLTSQLSSEYESVFDPAMQTRLHSLELLPENAAEMCHGAKNRPEWGAKGKGKGDPSELRNKVRLLQASGEGQTSLCGKSSWIYLPIELNPGKQSGHTKLDPFSTKRSTLTQA